VRAARRRRGEDAGVLGTMRVHALNLANIALAAGPSAMASTDPDGILMPHTTTS
jgi:hypothetical protein